MGRRAAAMAVCVSVLLIGSDTPQAQQYFGRNKVHYDRLDFRRLQTTHFDIYYYDEEETAAREAARMAERWYWRYSALLDFAFDDRQPVVLYAAHNHFAQTNLTPGQVSEGTGGFTEAVKSRIAMPFAAGLGETDHVLGHEIAHAFQIAIAKSAGQNAFALPLWFIEGMAEYLSVGPSDAHTLMWVRDAALHGQLPTFKQLEDRRYSPYRYGHALWSYVCGRFGDEVLGRILRSKGTAAVRLQKATGLDVDQLVKEWHASIAKPRVQPEDAVSPRVDAAAIHAGNARLHLGPALSPDGTRLMFLSERDRLSLDLFMADTKTGSVVRRMIGIAADPHFDSLQYIQSAGAWDPSGRRFTLSAVTDGRAALVVFDTDTPNRRREFRFDGVHEIYSPSWSPDGERIAFSALKNGLSDLFVYSLKDGTLTQVTNDAFADLHPAWSPDGRTLAFATDRFTTTLADLRYGRLRIGLLDVASGTVREAVPDAPAVKQINPQWQPDGRALYVIRDPGGISNVYRVDLATGALLQITDVPTGVSGITPTSPALAVAASAGTLAVSVYRGGRYEIDTIEGPPASAAPDTQTALGATHVETRALEPPAILDPRPSGDTAVVADDPVKSPPATVTQMLGDAASGLPASGEFATAAYDDRLRLESIAPPYVGAGTGGAFGSAVRGGFGMTFGDLLKDRQLQVAMTAGTRVDDFAAQISYMNRRNRWNWGVGAGFQPARFYGARAAIETSDGIVTRESSSLRYVHQWGGLVGRYNIDRSRRIEVRAGVRRTGFSWQTTTRVIDADGHLVRSERSDDPAGAPIFLAETQAAFVYDTSVSGPLGPVVGKRLRIEVEPAFGPLAFADVRADARRYFMPLRPVTFAVRLQHVGRYGPDAADPRLTPLVAGLQTMVRGYDLRTFAIDRCGRTARSCSMVDELSGSRFAVVNLEARAPIPGLFRGALEYPGIVPVEAIAFVDAGYLWTRSALEAERDRFRSVGAGARVNLGGVVFEVTAARAFDRIQDAWTTSFLIRPGW